MTNKKDAYYFPHFCNARHDRKIKRIRKELGPEGYGIFFMLLEILREQTDLKYPLQDVDLLADEIGSSEQKVRIVICNYKLFEIDEEEKFFSPKLIFYLQPYFEKSERARLAAKKRWSDANAYANALPEHCDSNASKVKESKVNQSKEDEEIKLPSLNENQTKLLGDVVDFFGVRQHDENLIYRKIYMCLTHVDYQQLKDSFEGYKKVKSDRKFIHNVEKWIGTYDNKYKDGIWFTEDWKTKSVKAKNEDTSHYQVISSYI